MNPNKKSNNKKVITVGSSSSSTTTPPLLSSLLSSSSSSSLNSFSTTTSTDSSSTEQTDGKTTTTEAEATAEDVQEVEEVKEQLDNSNNDDNDNDNDSYDIDYDEELMNELINIGMKLKLHVFDMDEGIFGYISKDYKYGLEVIRATKTMNNNNSDGGSDLGLVLTELASSGSSDGRGLVLISHVQQQKQQQQEQDDWSSPIHVGDAITGVSVINKKNDNDNKNDIILFRERTTGLDYDSTIDIIQRAKQVVTDAVNDNDVLLLSFELNRLVKRSTIIVEVVEDNGNTTVRKLKTLAGDNLRSLLLKNNIPLYDKHTKRFDIPYSTGNCGGDGLCGTCLVQILNEQINNTNENEQEQSKLSLLNEKDDIEQLILQGRPISWRASCRTILGGKNNIGGTIRIQTCPQSKYDNEQNPGVRDINPRKT